MTTDYSILEKELTDQKAKLERDLHMHQLRRLQRKQSTLSINVVQRKQIENLEKQLAELETTVSTVYCPHYALKDSEIKGYLVYLLEMEGFFSREVATKKEMINQRESEIKLMTRKLSSVVNEKGKLIKNIREKSPEYIRLENMSNRLNQIKKNVSIVKQENQRIMENVLNVKQVQNQFKKLEKDLRLKINYLREKSLELVEKAVTSYEEKDEFMNRERMLQERCVQDKRKIAINENALDLCLQKAEKNDAFAKLQDVARTDIRIAKTSEMIEKRITGLEPNMDKMEQLQSEISAAAREENPEKIEENFKLDDNMMGMVFSYLDELFKDIHHLQRNISNLKEENENLIRNMSATDRKLRKEIKIYQKRAQFTLEYAEEEIKSTNEARAQLHSLLEVIKSVYIMCFPDDESLEQKPIHDSTAIDYLQSIEKQLLDYLICLEYIRMKEASKEDQPVMLETEEDENDNDQTDREEDMDIVQPRTLSSKCELQSLVELEEGKTVMEFEELKEKAVAALAEIQSEKDGNEDEDVN